MMKIFFGFVLLICLASCGGKANINPVTETAELDFKDLQARYDIAGEVEKEELVGDWKRLSSFFTTEKTGARGVELKEISEKISLMENGSYKRDGMLVPNIKWELIKNNTIFTTSLTDGQPGDKWKIRVANDTFELIQKVEGDFIYEAYARVK